MMLSLKMVTGLLSLLLLLVLPAAALPPPPPEKPGLCPQSSGVGICIVTCKTDFDCPGDEKCCGGCPRECKPPVPFEDCCYGNETFKNGDLVKSFPSKCMQLYCDNGTNIARYYDTPLDCNCCEFNGKLYKNGERIKAICTDMTCRDGKWYTGGWLDKCCSKCNLLNDPHITTFDGYYYDWHGKCNYSISQLQSGYDEEFGIYGQFRKCFYGIPDSSCINITTFTDNPNTVIQIFYNEGPIAWVNSQLYNVQNSVESVNHDVLAWRSGNCNMFLGTQGYLLKTCQTQVFVWAYPNLMNQVNGLCGHYNGYKPDDFTDRTGIQRDLEFHPYTFPKSWLTNDQSEGSCPGPWLPEGGTGPPVEVEDPCKADAEGKKKLTAMCTALFLHVRWEGHGGSQFIVNVAIWSCVTDICIMEQNGIAITIINEWKIELKVMLQVNIEIEIHTTIDAQPPSEDSEHSESEHSEDTEHSENEHSEDREHSEISENSLCTESGSCKNPRHFKANMNFQVEFGNRHH